MDLIHKCRDYNTLNIPKEEDCVNVYLFSKYQYKLSCVTIFDVPLDFQKRNLFLYMLFFEIIFIKIHSNTTFVLHINDYISRTRN